MAINAYLNFDGNCLEAVDFYADAFHAQKQAIMRYGDMPADPESPLSEAAKTRVMHTFLNIGGSMVMLSDLPEGMPLTVGNNFSLAVVSRDEAEVKAAFDRLKDGGEVILDLQPTPWSRCYGFVRDRFGVGWQLNLEG